MDSDFATKADLKAAMQELREFIVEREVVALRWIITLQITCFFGTLTALWFMLAHYKNP
jgi:predicted outer membrane lipoprotein